MKKGSRILLIAAAIACFAIALSYPVIYGMQQKRNANTMEELAALRDAGMANEDQAQRIDEATEAELPAGTRVAPAEAAVPNQEEIFPEGEEESAQSDAETGANEQVSSPAEDSANEPSSEAASQLEVNEPQTAAESQAEAQPRAAVQPQAEVQPQAVEQPQAEAQSQAAEQPQLEAQPQTEAQPQATVQPQAETQPQAVEQPQAEAQPQAAEQPQAVEQPQAEAQLQAAEQPQSGNKNPVEGEASGTRSEPAPQASAPSAAYVAQEVQGEAPVASAAPRASEAPEGAVSAGATEAPVADEPESEATPAPTPVPTATPTPAPTVNRRERSGVLPYPEKEKVEFDPDRMLQRYKAIYKLNEDLVGWITIPGTDVNYPVVQSKDSQYYLEHDFFGEENVNGQIILDPLCDPYTPSYNLVISGHNMRTGSMFGELDAYTKKSYWQEHKFVQFDSLMDERQYVIIAAFYSADYDVDEAGFRYNANIQYRMDADQWLADVRDNQLYDTGIDAEFGDEFLTLTTCNRERRKDGRFVLVCRRIREGETFE